MARSSTTTFLAHLGLICAYTLFALYDIIVREVMDRKKHPIPLPLFLLIREVGFSLLLLPLALSTEGAGELKRVFYPRVTLPSGKSGGFSFRTAGHLFLSGMLGILLSQLMYGSSIVLAGATPAAVIESLVPMFVIVGGLMTGLEKADSWWHGCRKLLGVAAAVGGAIFIIAGSGHHRHHHGEAPVNQHRCVCVCVCVGEGESG